MKITLLAQADLASHCALQQLLPELTAHHDVHLFYSSAHADNAGTPPPLIELAVFERKVLATLEQLPVQAQTLDRINSPEGLATLTATKPDLIISIRYAGILREQAIAIPRFGVINLHSGLLPDYRGVMASFRALLAGETELGTTLHYIRDAGIDTGGIIATSAMLVDRNKSYLWHVLNLYSDGCQLIIEAVNAIAEDRPVSDNPQIAGGEYFSFPTEADYATFAQAGLTLFNETEALPLPN